MDLEPSLYPIIFFHSTGSVFCMLRSTWILGQEAFLIEADTEKAEFPKLKNTAVPDSGDCEGSI